MKKFVKNLAFGINFKLRSPVTQVPKLKTHNTSGVSSYVVVLTEGL